MAWPIETDVQARTGITLTLASTIYSTSYSVNVTDLLARAKAWVASECNRNPVYGFDEATVTETVDGEIVIPVSHPPIVSVTSLKWDDTALTEADDDFYVYSEYVRIASSVLDDLETYPAPYTSRKIVELKYLGGYSDSTGTHVAIPAELKECVLEVATRWLLKIDHDYRTNRNADSITIGNYTASHKSDEKLLEDIRRRLERFRVMRYA
jgi:hypothetical protein